jgi:methyltransferase (TIGR00027 family)
MEDSGEQKQKCAYSDRVFHQTESYHQGESHARDACRKPEDGEGFQISDRRFQIAAGLNDVQSIRIKIKITIKIRNREKSMGSNEQIIENISDTALWVAHYRAMETERPDAHFHDPYAKGLAGERGAHMVSTIKGAQRNAWAMVVRTCVFDEVILRLVKEQAVDTVINLAAGLDTRPYRMPLPAALSWVEVDFPPILTFKEEKLKGETPVCRLERVKLDLSDIGARRELFARLGASAKNALVLSEGLLVYLTREQVTSLATDLHAQPAFRWWMIDFVAPRLLKLLQRAWKKQLASGGAVMQFAPEEGTDFYKTLGWGTAEFHSTWEDAIRLKRTMPLAWLWQLLAHLRSRKTRETYLRMSGNVLLEQS